MFTRLFGRKLEGVKTEDVKEEADAATMKEVPLGWQEETECLNEPEGLWVSEGGEEAVEQARVRVILFRECERRGRKLLFDSSSVEKVELAGGVVEDDLWTEVSDGVGYKYLPPARDSRALSEMIFGSAAVAQQAGNMKIHQTEKEEFMWSTLFPAPGITQGVTAGSGASLNSSFGFSFGSFHVSEAEDFVLPHLPESQPIDSGYFSCPASSVSTDSEPDLPNQARRRLSSNADTPDYGSLCSLQRRWLSAIESSLAPSSLPPPLPLAGSAPQFPLSNGGTVESGLGSRTASLLPQKQERGIATLGLAILVRQPLEQSREALFIRTAVMEDIFSALVHSVQEAYIHKRRFVATLHRGWQDVQKAIFSQWTVSQLARPAWHLLCQGEEGVLQEKLVTELVSLHRKINTKESGFFFSALLTGVLTHHLGWVETVMPSSRLGEGSLHKPSALGLEEYSKLHWYNPTKVQYHELHGMVGDPARSAKTLLVTESSSLAKRLVFVLSFFIRCSQVFKQDLVVKSQPELSGPLVTYRLDSRQGGMEVEAPVQPSPPLCQSHSSPTLARVQRLAPLDMRRTRSFMAGEGDLLRSPRDPWNNDLDRTEKVNFLIGDNECLDIKELVEEEEMSEGGSPAQLNGGFATKVVRDVDDDEVKEDEMDGVMVTELPLVLPEVVDSQPAGLPSLMCCTSEYTPGTVLQGCQQSPNKCDSWRAPLQADLLASAANSFVSPRTDECVAVVGDCLANEVSLVSAKQVVVGRNGLPVAMSPLVASLIESLVTTAELGLPASFILCKVEDELQQLYLQSCILAEYLLTVQFMNLVSIADALDLHPNDIPLLLAVASAHTPMVGKKFGLGFTADHSR